MSDLVTSKPTYRWVDGDRPFHTHTDRDGEQWLCNSAYCEEMHADPPSKGGPEPIRRGREPWRGR
jgi:hypothetical protein